MSDTLLEQMVREFAQMKGWTIEQRASVPTTPVDTSIYGQAGLFSTCIDTQLVNASVSQPGIANWLNWVPSTAARRENGVITFVGRDPNADAYEHPATACADCEDQSTFTSCDWCWLFGRYCSQRNTLDILETGLMPCDNYPELRLLGVLTDDTGNPLPAGGQNLPITNDYEWTAIRNGRSLATTVADQMWNGTGGGTAPNLDMLGLATIVNNVWETRVDCLGAEPDVKNFNETCIGDQYSGYSICDYVQNIIDMIYYRAQAGLNMIPEAGDIGIWSTPNVARELLHEWDCCRAQRCIPASAGNTVFIDSEAVMQRRDRRYRTGAVDLQGIITVDQGIEIPVYGDHHITNNRVGNQEFADIYVLTKSVRGFPVLFGEYQDFRQTIPTDVRQQYTDYAVSDNGMFAHWFSSANACVSGTTWLKPRIVARAPWLQGRITNVCAETLQFLPYPDEVYGGDNTPNAINCDTLVS